MLNVAFHVPTRKLINQRAGRESVVGRRRIIWAIQSTGTNAGEASRAIGKATINVMSPTIAFKK